MRTFSASRPTRPLSLVAAVAVAALTIGVFATPASAAAPAATASASAEACAGRRGTCEMPYEECLRAYSREQCDRFVPIFEIPSETGRPVEGQPTREGDEDTARESNGSASSSGGGLAGDGSAAATDRRPSAGRGARTTDPGAPSPAQVANVTLARTGFSAIAVLALGAALLALGAALVALGAPARRCVP